MNSPFDDYVGTDTAVLYLNETPDAEGNDPKILHLLWGDGVKLLHQGAERTQIRARGRNRTGWVPNECLGGKSLMEFYYIDVGQGDGILIKTPDFQHILIDGGWPRKSQDTGKNAADFVDWKFFQDYGMDQIELEAMICSHNDQDHYGGLWDVLNPDQQEELDVSKVYVKDFYHAGLGWWKKGTKKSLGDFEPATGETFFTQLMGDRAEVEASLGGTGPQLAGEWAHFLRRVTEAKWKNNQPTAISRLSHLDEHLPGFTTKTEGKPAIKILAPVEFDMGGTKAIRRFPGGDPKNTNGNSIMLRVDFGRTRTILTGDLNKSSQTWLLKDYEGYTQEFECDVAKSCHHGSDDVSYSFLQRLRPAVTVISSGDNEGHDHPRPSIVAASATIGHFELKDDELVSPLVFSTELARSVSFGNPFKLVRKAPDGTDAEVIEGADFDRAEIHFTEVKSGDRNPRTKSKDLEHALVVAGLIYGLVNVRTDGDTILCATLDEKDHNWRIHKIRSRF